jgi:Zn-dependent peptidase ImmA (M78 family)
MNRIAINEQVLQWAVERVGLTPESLLNKFPKIKEWFSGKNKPTLRQLESLANITLTPLGFLFLNKPPEERLPIPYFRTLDDESSVKPSPDLLETIRVMQRRQDWMREFLIDQGHKPLPFVRSVKKNDSPPSVADSIRRALNLSDTWADGERTWTDALYTFRNTIEELGIIVVVNGIVGNNTHRKLNPNEFRGFVLVDEYAPLIFVNGADTKAAQMFTLTHELAHVFLGNSAVFDLREMQPADDPNEQMCNMTAAEFLIPERKLLNIWPSIKNSVEPFQELARKFKVSTLVAARRTLDIGLINKKVFFDFYNAYQHDERRKSTQQSGGGDFYLNQNLRIGRRFASAVLQATKEGKMLYSEAYRLTGLHGNTFENYIKSLIIGKRL